MNTANSGYSLDKVVGISEFSYIDIENNINRKFKILIFKFGKDYYRAESLERFGAPGNTKFEAVLRLIEMIEYNFIDAIERIGKEEYLKQLKEQENRSIEKGWLDKFNEIKTGGK